MTRSMHEADWKVFRELHRAALERFCERVLAEVGRILADAEKSSHERYLAVFRLIQERDEEVAEMFNDFRRSAAITQLARIQARNLLTDEEMARFSPETREAVPLLMGFRSGS